MTTRYLSRSLLTTKHSFASAFSRSCAAAVLPNSSSFLFRLRPLVAAAYASYFRRFVPAISTKAFSTRQYATSPIWSNCPPKETLLLDGCDFEHWLVILEKPEGDPSRDEIIDSYIKTLAMVVGRHYYAFGALVPEELSYKLKELPKVRWVLPDSYLDAENKDYGGEPFINGQAVPYDPKYHEEWVRNNTPAKESRNLESLSEEVKCKVRRHRTMEAQVATMEMLKVAEEATTEALAQVATMEALAQVATTEVLMKTQLATTDVIANTHMETMEVLARARQEICRLSFAAISRSRRGLKYEEEDEAEVEGGTDKEEDEAEAEGDSDKEEDEAELKGGRDKQGDESGCQHQR